ncbi:MAG: hypothetical protein CMM00_00595 [Rhodopirellula sp.]|nr:hypothetical protein [Rhodopirellula sp.]MCR9210650.1 hypothetical protein [bacterium]
MKDSIGDHLTNWLDDVGPELPSSHEPITEDNSEEIGDALLVHGLLSDLGHRNAEREQRCLQRVMDRIVSNSETTSLVDRSIEPKASRRFAIVTYTLTVAASIAMISAFLMSQHDASAAHASLEKIIVASKTPLDRTYRVQVLDEHSPSQRPGNSPRGSRRRVSEEQIDGATLYVRGANQYVLTLKLRSGHERTSGCDGKFSWAFREDGPVHVSTDLTRFRGGVPGHQQDIPFLNIHSHLAQLQNDYEVELSDTRATTSNGVALMQLMGHRKSNDFRGPKQIVIWFAASNGTVHTMQLDGLPRGRGGPKGVILDLQDQSDLPNDFYSHDAHHGPGKGIKHE